MTFSRTKRRIIFCKKIVIDLREMIFWEGLNGFNRQLRNGLKFNCQLRNGIFFLKWQLRTENLLSTDKLNLRLKILEFVKNNNFKISIPLNQCALRASIIYYPASFTYHPVKDVSCQNDSCCACCWRMFDHILCWMDSETKDWIVSIVDTFYLLGSGS